MQREYVVRRTGTTKLATDTSHIPTWSRASLNRAHTAQSTPSRSQINQSIDCRGLSFTFTQGPVDALVGPIRVGKLWELEKRGVKRGDAVTLNRGSVSLASVYPCAFFICLPAPTTALSDQRRKDHALRGSNRPSECRVRVA